MRKEDFIDNYNIEGFICNLQFIQLFLFNGNNYFNRDIDKI